MILGTYSNADGARINAALFIPGIAVSLSIPFVIDTGSEVTTISRRDLRDLGTSASVRIPLRTGGHPLSGVGGPVNWSEFDGGLTFIHEEGHTTMIAQPLALIANNGLPSLLGRDILSKGVLTVDGPGRQVTFDMPAGFIR